VSFLSRLSRIFKIPEPPSEEEIEVHLRRLNSLVLGYQDVERLRDELELDKLVAHELQWFKRHHLKLTRTIDGQHVLET
jgi:hypothetical protein